MMNDELRHSAFIVPNSSLLLTHRRASTQTLRKTLFSNELISYSRFQEVLISPQLPR